MSLISKAVGMRIEADQVDEASGSDENADPTIYSVLIEKFKRKNAFDETAALLSLNQDYKVYSPLLDSTQKNHFYSAWQAWKQTFFRLAEFSEDPKQAADVKSLLLDTFPDAEVKLQGRCISFLDLIYCNLNAVKIAAHMIQSNWRPDPWGDSGQWNKVAETIAWLPLMMALSANLPDNRRAFTKDSKPINVMHNQLHRALMTLLASELFRENTPDITPTEYAAGSSGGASTALLGLKYLLAKWIRVFELQNSWLIDYMVNKSSQDKVKDAYAEALLITFLTEAPTEELLNRSRKWLLTRYLSVMAESAELDLRGCRPNEVLNSGQYQLRGILQSAFILSRVAAHERRQLGTLFQEFDSGQLASILANMPEEIRTHREEPYNYTTLYYSRMRDCSLNKCKMADDMKQYYLMLFSPDILDFVDAGGQQARHHWVSLGHAAYMSDFYHLCSEQAPVWVFMSILGSRPLLLAKREIFKSFLHRPEPNKTGVVQPQRVYSVPTLFKQCDLQFKNNAMERNFSFAAKEITIDARKAHAPKMLPERIFVMSFRERSFVRVPMLFCLDENWTPSVLIPLSSTTSDYLLESYGYPPNDRLQVHGPLSDTFLDISRDNAQVGLVDWFVIHAKVAFNPSDERKGYGYVFKSKTIVDISSYFGVESNPASSIENMFLKLNLYPTGSGWKLTAGILDFCNQDRTPG